MIKEQLFFSTHLIYKSLTGKEVSMNPDAKHCIICGFHTDELKHYEFSGKFLDFNKFMDTSNNLEICPACTYVVQQDRLNGLHNHYIADGDTLELFNLNHSEMKDKQTRVGFAPFSTGQRIVDLLVNPPKDKVWMLMIRELGAMNVKHISLNAKTNYGVPNLIWVNISQSSIALPYFPDNTYQELYDALYLVKEKVKANDRRVKHFLEGTIPYKKYEHYDLWKQVDPILKEHRNTVYFDFMYRYVVPSNNLIEKIKNKNKRLQKKKK